MTQSENDVRTNRLGDRCPQWCTQDHGREVVPQVFADTHSSDPMATVGRPGAPRVQVIGDGRVSQFFEPGPDQVMISVRSAYYTLTAEDADKLADLLAELALLPRQEIETLAIAVRAAAGVLEGAAEAAL